MATPHPEFAPAAQRPSESYLRELRLFLEGVCCNVCRFLHTHQDKVAPQDIRITQESWLGECDRFADIRVEVKGRAPYFIEVKYGYPPSEILTSVTRKYGPGSRLGGATKIVLVVDGEAGAMWPELAPQIQLKLQPGLQLEMWDEAKLLAMIREHFGVSIETICGERALDLRAAVESAEGKYAFGESWTGDELQRALMWHCGFWRLQQLRAAGRLNPRTILPPGLYPAVVVVMADLCGFSGYVRDTRSDDVIRHCLTSFYAKARYEILNTGGMTYQFVGDEVIGLYGIPDRTEGYMESVLECARALADIGNSMSHEWQRQIDRVQNVRGIHIGIALGDMQIVSLRPFSRAHLGGIGEVINMAARLLAEAGPSEIMASNSYYQALKADCRSAFTESQAVEAKNMGRIQAWKAKLYAG